MVFLFKIYLSTPTSMYFIVIELATNKMNYAGQYNNSFEKIKSLTFI